MTDLRGNETAREFRIANSKRGPWDILGYVTVEDCDKLIAEYHSSQMSGIAQRAAEKVSEQLQSELNEMGIGYKPNVEFFKEIISQVSKVERGEG